MKEKNYSNSGIETEEYFFGLTKVRILALFLAPLFAIATYYMTLSQGTAVAGALSITLFAAILWLSEALPLPVTAMLIPVSLASVGVFELQDAYTSFGSSVLFLVLGGYALAVAVEANKVDKWIAQHILNLSGSRTIGLFVAFMSTSALLSMLISNTAVTAKLAPILVGVALQLGLETSSLVVPVAIATSMAFMLPVATPPNALVYASGHIMQTDMMKVGLRLNLAAVLVITLLFYSGLAG